MSGSFDRGSNMSGQILTDWDAEKSAVFGKQAIIAQHNLHQRDMFSDEGLIELLDRYPRHKLGIYTMGTDPLGTETIQAGTAEGLSGKDIMEAVHRGRFWLNLRRTSDEFDDYHTLCDDMFDDLEDKSGENIFKRDVGVLISSPGIQVFYHLDIPMVTLWQLRGSKRIRLYKPERPFLENIDLERVVLRESEEEIPFRLDFDDQALTIDLEPGMMVTWPQFGPHRIVNHDVVNVSLSCEFQTYMSILRSNSVYANGVLRRNFGMNPMFENDGVLGTHTKAIAARLFKILKLRKSFEYHKPKTFKIDPSAERGLSELSVAA